MIERPDKMLRVVLDTNVLIASISHRSPFHGIWQSFLKGKYELCVTSDILVEYAEVIQRKYSVTDAENILEQMLVRPNLTRTIRYFEWNVIEKDPDDNKFFDCAVAANANYIVTEDRHFRILSKIAFPSVATLNASEFRLIV